MTLNFQSPGCSLAVRVFCIQVYHRYLVTVFQTDYGLYILVYYQPTALKPIPIQLPGIELSIIFKL